MKLFTIGFTKTSADSFFGRIKKAGVRKVVDVRLNNVSQLAGFAKMQDLSYFLKTICGVGYEHRLELAPTQAMLDSYRNSGGWNKYEAAFKRLLGARRIEKSFKPSSLDGACLLCSEDKPHHCHRRLVAEYLRDKWSDVQIIDL